jgi:ribonuclease P protein component
MIRKTHRLPLTAKNRFRGRRIGGQSCQLILAPSPLPHYRLAIIVGKKVSRLAVSRNRLKRLVAAKISHELTLFPPLDCLVILKPQAGKVPAKELLDELDRHMLSVKGL